MKLKQKLIAAILTVMMLTSYMAILTDVVIAAGVNLTNQILQHIPYIQI